MYTKSIDFIIKFDYDNCAAEKQRAAILTRRNKDMVKHTVSCMCTGMMQMCMCPFFSCGEKRM